MAPSVQLKAAGILAASCILAFSYLYQPGSSTSGAYYFSVKAAAGILVIMGSALLSSAIGRTFLKNTGRGAFKALYLAAVSSAGAGAAVLASAFSPMNIKIALFSLSAVFAIAGACVLRFFHGVDA